MRWALWAIAGILSITISPARTWAIVTFQTDDFEDATTMGWTNGAGGAGIVNVVPGGPMGAGDHFVKFSSGSFGGATRLIMFNDSQWTGDYGSMNVFQIAMDLKNFNNAASVPIRLAIREANSTSTTPGYCSTVPFIVPNDGQWHHVTFNLDEASLTPINSPQPYSTDIADVDDFRILSSAAPSLIGDAISGQVGVDNMSTVQDILPEPSTILALTGLAALGTCVHRRRRAA
jgi:hypothetical protein